MLAPRLLRPRGAVHAAFALAILVLGLVLRWDLDDDGIRGVVLLRTDENHYLDRVEEFASGDWSTDYFVNPTLYMYVLYGALLAVGAVAVATGRYASWSAFLLDLRLDSGLGAHVGRGLTLATGVATLGVLVLVGRKLGSTRAGLFAALALAVATVHVERSGIVGNEAPMTLAVLLAFLAALRYVERPDARRHALAGAAVGLAASLKYNAGTAAVTLLVATWIAVRRARADHGRRAWTAPSAFVGFPCAALAFLAGSPCVLVNPGAFWRDFTYQASLMERGFGPRALGWSFYPLHFADELSGIGVAVACAVGLAWTVERAVRGRAWALLLLAATVPTYVVLGRSVFSQMRFLLPAIPFVFLMGGLALDAAVERLPWRAGTRGLAFLLLTSLAVQPHARPLVAWARVHDRADPRAPLAAWVHEHLDRDHPVFVAPSHLRVDVVPRVPPRGRLGRLDRDEAALYERRAAEAWTVRPLRSLLLEHATLDEFWAALTGGEETTVVCTAWAPRPAPPRANPVQEVGRLLRRLPALRQAAPYWGEALDRLLALPVEVSIVGRGRRDFLVAFRLR